MGRYFTPVPRQCLATTGRRLEPEIRREKPALGSKPRRGQACSASSQARRPPMEGGGR